MRSTKFHVNWLYLPCLIKSGLFVFRFCKKVKKCKNDMWNNVAAIWKVCQNFEILKVVLDFLSTSVSFVGCFKPRKYKVWISRAPSRIYRIILATYNITFKLKETWKTEEIIINHTGARMVKIGQNLIPKLFFPDMASVLPRSQTSLSLRKGWARKGGREGD